MYYDPITEEALDLLEEFGFVKEADDEDELLDQLVLERAAEILEESGYDPSILFGDEDLYEDEDLYDYDEEKLAEDELAALIVDRAGDILINSGYIDEGYALKKEAAAEKSQVSLLRRILGSIGGFASRGHSAKRIREGYQALRKAREISKAAKTSKRALTEAEKAEVKKLLKGGLGQLGLGALETGTVYGVPLGATAATAYALGRRRRRRR